MPRRSVLLIPLVLIALAATAGPDSPAPVAGDTAWPRCGPIAVVEITIGERTEIDVLTEAGFNVSNVQADVVTIHAAENELVRLDALGYRYKRVGAEPNPPAPEQTAGAKALGAGYHTYQTLTEDLEAYAADFPAIARLFTLGQSVQGRELWALLISDNPDVEEDEPEFKYVSTMHGSEPVGTEMSMYLIDLLLNSYGADSRITDLIDGTAIWIVPLMNPDGLELGIRYNAQGFDLNRTFPRWPEDWQGAIFDGAPLDNEGRPPEVSHVMAWTAANSFVLSANFHTGALVVNYPFDDDDKPSGTDAPTPDDLLFEDISRRYSIHNVPMWNSPSFPDGITNGTAWYSIPGGMQDWNYRYVSCNEVTVELSDELRPNHSELSSLWDDNREAMLSYLEAMHIGVRGIVTDRATGQPLYARVVVEGNSHHVYTDADIGDYYRMLLPGDYTLHYMAHGYRTETVTGIAVAHGPAARVDVELALITATDADVNDDGVVDALDVQLVINALLGLPVSCDCDVDGGGLSATDLQSVINAALDLL